MKEHPEMISQQIKATLLASAILSCAAAPESFAQAGQNSGPKDNILATLQLKDGGVVQFNEPAPGELVVLAEIPVGVGKTKAADAINGVKFRDLDRLDAVGQYRALADGAEVPAALAQAQQRVARAQRASVAAALKTRAALKAPASDASGKAPASPKTASADSTGSWFQTYYCPSGGYSFNFCWLYRTGDGYVERNASSIKSVLYPYRGNVSHKLQYKTCFLWSCTWHTSISRTVLQGFVNWISQSGSRMGRRATVYEGSGDGFHWAVYGS
jgi:hypothetical protein